ncbi:SDR family NAD(P)-dependent oxidoreductase [Thalassobaculum salexigens]|jgi:NAD(P)-dependent dehydrogenase (short-subunit alcohol dehydrogenase family)|uniref:SDR family NAD(P)-dependent oxidoreductase n=1 Tax=Thalassobaculum salexigens TaxID=455360 RepID=UPI000400E1E7|nr:SDR family NAD(P)-dependent oxidoreductase [Thalassobaculum salexigens]
MGRLDGKIAIITGAAAGIGKASAALFAREGATVVMADVKADLGETAAAAIRDAGGTAEFVTTDVSKEDDVRALIDGTVERHGRIDVLYNNAGGATPKDGKVTEMPLDEFWRTISVDLFGPFLGCRFAIPHMERGGGGSIINTTSIRALTGTAGADAYSSAKGGVIALTKALAMQWHTAGIRVNAIGPGMVLTERVAAMLDPETNPIAIKSLMGPMEPDDIAYLALYLASDESRKITGAIYPAESGASAH